MTTEQEWLGSTPRRIAPEHLARARAALAALGIPENATRIESASDTFCNCTWMDGKYYPDPVYQCHVHTPPTITVTYTKEEG